MTVELPWHRFTASWQPDPNAPAETFYSEDGPGPVVYVRLRAGLSEIYNAGERDDNGRHPTQRWPGAPRRRAGNRHPNYGGVVWVDEEQAVADPARRG
jgi:hypothetical protein